MPWLFLKRLLPAKPIRLPQAKPPAGSPESSEATATRYRKADSDGTARRKRQTKENNRLL